MSKKNLILLGVLAFLILAAVLIKIPFENWPGEDKDNNFLADLVYEKINKIEIINNDLKTILEKSGSDWKIAGTKDFYADPSLAAELNVLLQDFNEIEFDLMSENKEKKSDFMGETGVLVKIYEEDDLASEFLVGEIGTTYPSTYLSKPDSDFTYMVNKDFNYIFSFDDWRDKTIISLNADSINMLRIQNKDEEYKLKFEEEQWAGFYPSEFEVNQEKLNSLLEIARNLSAVEIPEQKFEGTGLEKNNLILQFIGEGIDQAIMVGGQDGESGNYFAKRADSDNIYLISGEQKNSLDLKLSDIKK